MKRMKTVGFIPKKEFLKKWSKLRKLLYETTEYQSFLREVRLRALYNCEGKKCDKKGRHVHHVIRVYDDPDLSVDPNNAVFLCISCHRKEHKKEKEQ